MPESDGDNSRFDVRMLEAFVLNTQYHELELVSVSVPQVPSLMLTILTPHFLSTMTHWRLHWTLGTGGATEPEANVTRVSSQTGQDSTIRNSRSRSPMMLQHRSAAQTKLADSITNVVDSVICLLEKEQIDRNHLEKRILHYFNQGAKGLEFGQKTCKELVNDYADSVYSAMFSGLDAKRNWLTQTDFLLVVDAGVKAHFPSDLLDGGSRLHLERTILQAVEIQEGSYFLGERTNFQKHHLDESTNFQMHQASTSSLQLQRSL